MKRIYLDYAATTPTDPEVVKAMLPHFTEGFGNPSSIHSYGQEAKGAIVEARAKVADLIGAQDEEIVFTSGGTEADNFALKGIAYANESKGNHIITSPIEHHAILETARFLERRGFKVSNVILEQVLADSDEKVARLLEIEEGAPVVKIRRVRELDGRPAALSTTYVSKELCPDLIHEDLTQQSLYYLIEKKYGLRIHKGHRFIGACLAEKDVAATLRVREGSPIITLENVSYLDNGRPIEFFTSFHRGDVSKFEITIHRVPDDGQ